eukprot:SAG31_NODE_16945_length_689_cov_1.332203_2_plen_56_part_00
MEESDRGEDEPRSGEEEEREEGEGEEEGEEAFLSNYELEPSDPFSYGVPNAYLSY